MGSLAGGANSQGTVPARSGGGLEEGGQQATAALVGPQAVLTCTCAACGSTARMRSMAFSSVCLLQAKDRRMCPGAPNPEPGTTATPALLIKYSEKELSSRIPRLAIAPRTSAKA